MERYDDTVYLHSFFNFTADEFDQGFKATVEMSTVKFIKEAVEDSKENKSEESITKLMTLASKLVSDCSEDIKDDLESCSRKIKDTFKIPDNILHPNDETNLPDYSEEGKQQIRETIEALELRAKQAIFLKRSMEKELEENKLLLITLKQKCEQEEDILKKIESQVQTAVQFTSSGLAVEVSTLANAVAEDLGS